MSVLKRVFYAVLKAIGIVVFGMVLMEVSVILGHPAVGNVAGVLCLLGAVGYLTVWPLFLSPKPLREEETHLR